MPTLPLASMARGQPQPRGHGSVVRSRNSPPRILKGPPALVLVRRTDKIEMGKAGGATLGSRANSWRISIEPRSRGASSPRQRATAIPEALCLTLRRHAPRRYSCLTARPGHAENLGLHSCFYCVHSGCPCSPQVEVSLNLSPFTC